MDPKIAKKARIRKACDSCNVKRTKCDGDLPCGHCVQVKIECTYLRQEKRRGRASEKYPKQIKKRKTKTDQTDRVPVKNRNNVFIASKKPGHGISHGLATEYPITNASTIPSNSLLISVPPNFDLGTTKYPVLMNAKPELLKIGIPFAVADALYEYYFDAHFQPATKVFSILRRIPMLASKRPTQSNLLLCIMLSSAAQINHRFFVGSNRDYACQALYKQIQQLLPSLPDEFTLDDFLCVVHLGFFMPWLSYPSDSVFWWKLGYDVSKKLNLTETRKDEPNDAIEEKLRGWWALFIMDRMTSLCFNLPTAITDEEANRFCLPCDEITWNKTDIFIPNPYLDPTRARLINYKYVKKGISGWPLNICALIGKFTQFRDCLDPEMKRSFKEVLSQSLNKNLKAISTHRSTLDLTNLQQRNYEIDMLYARFINLVLSFMVEYENDEDIFAGLKTGEATTQFSNLEKCIEALEELSKADESLYKYPFISSFFLFVVGVSLLSTLKEIDSTDKVSITKINKYKYYVKIIVRVIEGLLVVFPGEFLKTIRNLLALSVNDCENLILLADYIEVFKENVKKTQDALKAYSWSENGRGIAV